jgi:purine-nucleoside phosphorylase
VRPPGAGETQGEGATLEAIDVVRIRAGRGRASVGLVLGSGLGHLAASVDGVAIGFDELPGFPRAGVSGHRAELVVGVLDGVQVAILAGRAHFYERGEPAAMRAPLETLRALGVERLVLTNAAGSLRPDLAAGDLMMVADHINLAGANPLIGEATEARFVNMTDAYDPDLRALLLAAAEAEETPIATGVYAWCSGPSFETPAEIRALRVLGADAVGMSTAPEVILARFLGMRVAAISVITNMAAGLGSETISHDHTKAMAPLGAAKLERVLRRFLSGRSRTA